MGTSQRKMEHLLLCAEHKVEAHPIEGRRASGLDDVSLIHLALPEINREDIDLTVEFLGARLQAPVLISSMTGGHPDTKAVNAALASAAETLGIGIGVGSQRAALEDPGVEDSFRVVREHAPDAFVYANIGVVQLRDHGVEAAQRVVEMIDADALAVHLNFLQEAVQPEGETDARGCLEVLGEVCREVGVPVIVKETGAGISREVARSLWRVGVSAIDIAGMGGTSWAGVEYHRAREQGKLLAESIGKLLWNWGVPTIVSLLECQDGKQREIIASGGIRNGLDIAKTLALGATITATALPLVAPALKGAERVCERVKQMLEELRAVMFLTGCQKTGDLRKIPVLITGRTREMLELRGIDAKKYSIKKGRGERL